MKDDFFPIFILSSAIYFLTDFGTLYSPAKLKARINFKLTYICFFFIIKFTLTLIMNISL